jgi:DNA-binding GntR family transcriptional regulator
MNTPTTSTKRPQKISTDALFSRIQVEDSFKAKAYSALKEAILKMDLYVKKNKREIIEMVQAWAALEGMAARLITTVASDADIKSLRPMFAEFNETHRPDQHLNDYSSANIAFHQAIIGMSGSAVLADMTEHILLHVRGIRQLTIGRDNRAQQSIKDHLGIIDALERRETELAERLSREHTLRLAAYVDEHGDELFG